MWFITVKLTVPGVYWLVPIFGGLGGAVGGALRGSNALELCSFEPLSLPKSEKHGVNKTAEPEHWKINLGVVGEIASGLGGATAAVFLFGGTLKFDEKDPKTYVLLVSVSFLAGAFGKQVVAIAGERLLKEVGVQAKEAKVEAQSAQQKANRATAMGYTLEAIHLTRKEEPNEALIMAQSALELDPTYANAYGEKGRALRRLGRLEEALAAVEEGLKVDKNKAELLYNRACYKVLLGKASSAEVLEDLKKALALKPELKKSALKDEDLQALAELPEFIKLIGEG